MALRSYQKQAIDALRAHYATGSRKALLRMPTGAGKTVVFCEIAKTVASNGLPVIVVVRGRKLVAQASERLAREGVAHDVLMAGVERGPSGSLITIVSMDTAYIRQLTPHAHLIIIDEAHAALSAAFKWFYGQYAKAFFLAVTATPFHPGGFRDIADVIIEPITASELIARGNLVPARYFIPEKIDLSHVKRAGGEYVLKDLGEAMNQARLFGPIIATWQSKGEGRPTLLFAVNVAHSRRLADAFEKAGVPAAHIDANTPTEVRNDLLAAVSSGRIRVLCSVGVLTTGVDCPPIACVILARPTLSYNLHVQMIGRGTRPAPGKRDLIVLDHAGNVEKHGFYDTHRPATLDGKAPAFRAVTQTCAKCFCTWEPNADPACPGLDVHGVRCGYVAPPKQVKPLQLDEDVTVALYEADPVLFEEQQRNRWIDKAARTAAENGWRPGAAFIQIRKRYGDDVANKSWGRIRAQYKAQA